VNASLHSKRDGYYVRLYDGEDVYDEAGPFPESEDAELAAYRMVEGSVSRGALRVSEGFQGVVE
jgi:hypothetical protein